MITRAICLLLLTMIFLVQEEDGNVFFTLFFYSSICRGSTTKIRYAQFTKLISCSDAETGALLHG